MNASNVVTIGTTPDSPTPLPHLLERINALELEKSQLALPSLAELEGQILYHSARTHLIDKVEAAGHVASLQGLLESKRLAEMAWSRNGAINRELAMLKQEQQFAAADEAAHRANQASKDLAKASDAYVESAKACIRAYRRCMSVSRRNQGIPGAGTMLPPGPHIPLRGFGWGGGFSTYEEMQQGLLQFEREEMEQSK